MARACGRPRRAAPTSNQLVHSLSVMGVWGRNDRVSFHHGDTGHEKKSEKRHFCTCKSLKIKGRIFQISIFSHVHGGHGDFTEETRDLHTDFKSSSTDELRT